MASFGQGFVQGSTVVGGILDRKARREDVEFRREQERLKQEAINDANQQSQDVLKNVFEAMAAEEQDKAAGTDLVQPLGDIVRKKPGPIRSGDVEVFAQSLDAQGITLSPIARKVLEKEPTETALPIMKKIQSNVAEDPNPSFKKFSEILSNDLSTAQLFNESARSVQAEQTKGKRPPNPQRKRQGQIQVLQSQNKRLQQSIASLPPIGKVSPLARKQLENVIVRNQKRIDALREVKVFQGVGVPGTDQQVRTIAINPATALDPQEPVRELGRRAAPGVIAARSKREARERLAPQTPSLTKGEKEQTKRFISRNWPEGVPKLEGEELAGFIDILGSNAKENAKKTRTNINKGLNAVFDAEFKKNIKEGKIESFLGIDFLAKDEPTTVRSREQRANQADLEFTARKHGISVEEVERRLRAR